MENGSPWQIRDLRPVVVLLAVLAVGCNTPHQELTDDGLSWESNEDLVRVCEWESEVYRFISVSGREGSGDGAESVNVAELEELVATGEGIVDNSELPNRVLEETTLAVEGLETVLESQSSGEPPEPEGGPPGWSYARPGLEESEPPSGKVDPEDLTGLGYVNAICLAERSDEESRQTVEPDGATTDAGTPTP